MVKQCDEIVVMDQGEIVEMGSHEELVEKKGYYHRLWEMQLGNFQVERLEKSQQEWSEPESVASDEMSYV